MFLLHGQSQHAIKYTVVFAYELGQVPGHTLHLDSGQSQRLATLDLQNRLISTGALVIILCMELLISSHPQTIVVETTGLATGSQSYRVDMIMFLTVLNILVSTWLKSEFI